MSEDKLTYYLVSPHFRRNEKPRPFFWMLDEGGQWRNIIKCLYREKHAQDIVREVFEAEHITQLDWTKTPLYNHDCVSGWLSREGRFYGCPSYLHDMLAACVLDMKVPDLEKLGWVRIYDHKWFTCSHRLNAEQRNWLSMSGYKVQDGN